MRWKCRRGLSSEAALSLVCRFEWISSIRPLRYFVVTWGTLAAENEIAREKKQKTEVKTYGFVFLVKVIDVSVQYLDEELHRYATIHAGVRDAKRSLQALEDTLAIAIELRDLVSRRIQY